MVPKHRRNFLPTAIMNLILWVACGLIVFLLDPDKNLQFIIYNLQLNVFSNLILFFLTLTLTLTLTLALLLGNTRRGLLLTLFFDGFLLLQLFKLTNWLTLVFLFLILLVLEIYFSRRKTNL